MVVRHIPHVTNGSFWRWAFLGNQLRW